MTQNVLLFAGANELERLECECSCRLPRCLLQDQPLAHEPSVAWIKMSADAQARERAYSVGRQLKDQLIAR